MPYSGTESRGILYQRGRAKRQTYIQIYDLKIAATATRTFPSGGKSRRPWG